MHDFRRIFYIPKILSSPDLEVKRYISAHSFLWPQIVIVNQFIWNFAHWNVCIRHRLGVDKINNHNSQKKEIIPPFCTLQYFNQHQFQFWYYLLNKWLTFWMVLTLRKNKLVNNFLQINISIIGSIFQNLYTSQYFCSLYIQFEDGICRLNSSCTFPKNRQSFEMSQITYKVRAVLH